jgi:Fe2+ transport system protein B
MTVVPFLHGTVAMGCAVAAIFFVRFWRQSRDRLFLWFALAFSVLALSYTLLGTIPVATEWRVWVFVIRLLAFCLIVYGIVEKNRR